VLADVAAILRCPICGSGLGVDGTTLRCAQRHAFDIARQGYVNLAAATALRADTADMVAARQAVLARGHLDAVTDALQEAVATLRPAPRVIADAGAGTGHHLARLLDATPHTVGLAMDLSPYAARRAARAHPRIGAVVCDVWQPLPVRDAAVDVLLNVFAPRNGPEFRRLLAPHGRLIVITPTERHLAELIAPLGLLRVDEHKSRRLASTLGDWFEEEATRRAEATLDVGRDEVAPLVGMGPTAWHRPASALAEAAATLPAETAVTISCRVTTWRPRPDPERPLTPPA
jgi:23S rRNA (guanine745-N1)-methyltransferase